MKSSAWADKMNKEQSADDPSVDLIRVKNMLNSTISMSYPDVAAIACIEHRVSLPTSFRAIEVALVKHDNNMKDYSLVVDWSPLTANHSNYLVCDRANTPSLSLSGKW